MACTDVLSLSGAAASPSIPLLLRLMRDPSERIRRAALHDARGDGARGRDCGFFRWQRSSSSDRDEALTRDRAAEALIAMRGGAGPCCDSCRSPGRRSGQRIATLLSRWAKPPEAVRHVVTGVALQDRDPAVRGLLCGRIGSGVATAIALAPVALGLLEDEARVGAEGGIPRSPGGDPIPGGGRVPPRVPAGQRRRGPPATGGRAPAARQIPGNRLGSVSGCR